MSTVEGYAQGTPCYVELATPDPEAARAFYGELLGWAFRDDVAVVRGEPVAGVVAGADAVWWVHLAVAALDPDLEAREVPGRGRVAEAVDPTGAAARLWQADPFVGSVRVNEPGCPVWHELCSPDLPSATAYWAGLLGVRWQAVPMETGDDYTCLMVEGRAVGGAAPPQVEGPARWDTFFGVADCDAVVAHAARLGAEVVLPAYDLPGVGRTATLRDPQGARFGLLQSPS